MQNAPIPDDEKERLAALRGLEILDTPTEERFDRITRLAQRLFGVPITLVSLVDANRQWFKSRQGLDATETPRDISFCGHAILGDDIFLVPNASEDPRFHDNPLVTGAPGVCFYAAAPLADRNGYRVGTLCLIDRLPRQFSEIDRAALRDLAALAEDELAHVELAKAVAQIREHEQRLQGVLDTAVDGIVTIDAKGTVESFNPAAARIFGYASDEVIGRSLTMLMPPQYRDGYLDYLERFAASGEPRLIGAGREVAGMRRDGSTFAMELSVSAMLVDGRRWFTGILRDITQRKHAEKQLRETTALPKAILDSARYAIIATDVDGTIIKFNRAAELMLGYTAEEVVGKLTPALFHKFDEVVGRAAQISEELGKTIQPGFAAFVAKAVRHSHDEHEWTYVRKDGSTLPVLLTISTMRDSAEKITGFLGMAYDLSERRKVDQMKNEFISTVSHELRTPLTSIRGSLGLVCGGIAGPLSPQAKELVEIAHKNSERLVRLINDILDIEKIASGKMKFDLVSQPALPLVRQTIDANQGFAGQHQVELTLACKLEVVKVRVDSDRMVQVLTNLISNAVKFSPKGSSVTVAIERRGDWVRFTVADKGPGIPEEFRGRIFEKFSQADSSDQRQKGGTGLGLAITRSLVESMGGRVGFETSTAGTTFWVEMLESRDALAPALKAAFQGAAGPRVLICEDDPDVASLIAIILGNAGYRTDIASDAMQAMSMLSNNVYSAMTVDVMLPGKDGISLIRDLRAGGVARDLPVIVVSATDSETREPQLGGVALVDWITKPIDQARLLEAMRRGTRPVAHERARVLHVDDDHDTHRVIEAIAGAVGDFDHAYNLGSAIALLEANTYSLVILDLTLPDGCGRDLLPYITARDPAPKVVVFSATDVDAHEVSQFAACILKSATTNDRLLDVLRAQIDSCDEVTEFQQ